MHKRIRDGVDIEVALTSQLKRSSTTSSFPQQPQPVIPVSGGLLSRVKSMLRPIAGALYRAAKPFLRPFAFRLRRYMTGPLQVEILGFRASTEQEMQAIKAALQQGLQDNRASAEQEMQAVKAALEQGLQDNRASAEQEMQAIKAALQQGLQESLNHILPRLDRIEQCGFATARRVAINCGPEEVLVRTEVGYIMCSSRDHAVLACLLDTGELERGTRLLLQKLLKPGDVFIDVGANLGLHTIAAARAMHGRGRIVAFEPYEPTKRLLEKSVWMNGFSGMVEIHQAAVSSRAGHHRLFLGVTSGHHSLFPLSVPSGTKERPVDVPLVTLDGILAANSVVNLIKIDVEGAELEVLKGAESVITRNDEIALIVEFGPSHLRRTSQTAQDWLSQFQTLGLIHRVINADTGLLETWPIEKLEKVESVNLLMARPEAQVWHKAETS